MGRRGRVKGLTAPFLFGQAPMCQHQTMIVGILHPGAMGSAVGRCIQADVVWGSEARSAATAERAARSGFRDVVTLAAVAAESEMVISICPPAAAETVAEEVSDAGFDGVYVDANAIAPETSRRISMLFPDYVDGGIIGGPPVGPGETRLYLSGPKSREVAVLFQGSSLEARPMGDEIGLASALKAAYAGWTKGSAALLLNQGAYAQAEGVLDLLFDEFDLSIPGLSDRLRNTAGRVGLKAWRFVGEMGEIATAMGDRNLPAGFHQAARSIYAGLEDLKDEPDGHDTADLLTRIAEGPRSDG